MVSCLSFSHERQPVGSVERVLYPQDALTEVNNSLAVSLVIEKYFGTLNTECEARVLLTEMERTAHEPIGICGKVAERTIFVQV